MTNSQSLHLKTFRITSQHEAESFGNFLNQYCSNRLKMKDPIKPPYIGKLYSVGEKTKNGRLFSAAIDLELTYVFIVRDTNLAGMTRNQINATWKGEEPSVFNDSALFASKMDMLGAYTSLAYRCRAWWDKFMGVLILMRAEEKYERYMKKGRSRAKAFQKIAVEWEGFSPQLHSAFKNMLRTLLIHAKRKLMEETDFHGHPNEKQLESLRNTEISEIIRDFESNDLEYETILGFIGDIIDSLNEIRTAETHGTGMLRKWSLGSIPLSQSRDASLINHYNFINEIMHGLRQTLYEYG